LEYQDLCKVAALIDKGKHLTDEELAEILLIKDSPPIGVGSGSEGEQNNKIK
jgi:hypothetical protein